MFFVFFFCFFLVCFLFLFCFFFCCCFSGEHLNDFHHSFSVFSLLIVFFHVTNFLCTDCFFAAFFQVLRFCVVAARVLRVWESFFCPQAFFTPHSFPTFATIPRMLQIWERFFYPQAFFTLDSFRTCCTTGCWINLLSRLPWDTAVFP